MFGDMTTYNKTTCDNIDNKENEDAQEYVQKVTRILQNRLCILTKIYPFFFF